MNLFRTLIACLISAGTTASAFYLWPHLQEIADALGWDLIYAEIASLALLGTISFLCAMWLTPAKAPPQVVNVHAEGSIFPDFAVEARMPAPIIEPVDGKVILRPGQILKIVADMPRGAKGRYVGLDRAL